MIETPNANLVEGMQWLLGVYTARFNRRHKVFGLFPSIPNIPFVEFHVVFVQPFTALLLERTRAMMFLPVVYVESNRLNQPAQPYEAGRWPEGKGVQRSNPLGSRAGRCRYMAPYIQEGLQCSYTPAFKEFCRAPTQPEHMTLSVTPLRVRAPLTRSLVVAHPRR